LSFEYDLGFVRRRYNRLARVYPFFEFAFLLPPGIRGRAVKKIELGFGDRVLEVGCGTGRNLAHLVSAVGPQGVVYGVDASDGMLAKARDLCDRRGWQNVRLLQQDAGEMALPEPVDGVLFSLSYAVIPASQKVLAQAWRQLRSGGRVVIMDAKLPPGGAGKLLRWPVTVFSRATVLGDPGRRPWDELKELASEVEMEELSFRTYYICRGTKA
jgi:ubiquinone/menaquinone biosynthesis C-methylase UbiE